MRPLFPKRLGDPSCRVPNYLWDILRPEFPNVRYLDNTGRFGRTRVEFSGVPFYWSTPDAAGKLQDYIPISFAEADYIINFAIVICQISLNSLLPG